MRWSVNVKVFSGFETAGAGGTKIVIQHLDCAWCRRRTKWQDTWVEVDEGTVRARRRASSHGMCPSCAAEERARL